MIQITTAKNDDDLNGIIQLQQQNLTINLSIKEKTENGFLTVQHSLQHLQNMNVYEPHVVVKDHEKVVGYLLAMTHHSAKDIPALVPFFDLFDTIIFKNNVVSSYKYLVVGQACIAATHRGKGILLEAYNFYKNNFKSRYQFAITEIATNNHRSLKAHSNIGFRAIYTYTDSFDIEWCVVVWDWQ